ncbi:hypothetical protein [Allorhizobium undicola]|uniref:hypothetical protein n=1 Tax=Allorhizobium undicola TaxID=78527 RepID=UPI000686A905|nr:hypothetical protein [Allorhizobium undicola]
MKGRVTKVLAGTLALAAWGSAVLPANAADDAVEKVKEIMAVTLHNSMIKPGDKPPAADYWDPATLMVSYSRGFTHDLTAALLHMKDAGEQMFLDYEPVLGAQDGCPLRKVQYKAAPEDKGVTRVTVTFEAFYCLGDSPDLRKPTVVWFDLVREGWDNENRWFVVDDIRHPAQRGEAAVSLRENFRQLASH